MQGSWEPYMTNHRIARHLADLSCHDKAGNLQCGHRELEHVTSRPGRPHAEHMHSLQWRSSGDNRWLVSMLAQRITAVMNMFVTATLVYPMVGAA